MEKQTEEKFLKSYETYADAIFRHCFFRVSDRELAKDLMQEAFTRTWLYLAAGNTVADFKAFLYRTANNLVIDEYRKRKPISLDVLQEDGFDPSDDSHKHIESRAAGYEAIERLADLDETYRTVITLRYVDSFSPKEIAELLDLTENVVSVRIHRGLKKLHDMLEKPRKK